jgi:hypothetical protein
MCEHALTPETAAPVPSSHAAKAGQLRAVSELKLAHAVTVKLGNKQHVAHRDDPARRIHLVGICLTCNQLAAHPHAK